TLFFTNGLQRLTGIVEMRLVVSLIGSVQIYCLKWRMKRYMVNPWKRVRKHIVYLTSVRLSGLTKMPNDSTDHMIPMKSLYQENARYVYRKMASTILIQ